MPDIITASITLPSPEPERSETALKLTHCLTPDGHRFLILPGQYLCLSIHPTTHRVSDVELLIKQPYFLLAAKHNPWLTVTVKKTETQPNANSSPQSFQLFRRFPLEDAAEEVVAESL